MQGQKCPESESSKLQTKTTSASQLLHFVAVLLLLSFQTGALARPLPYKPWEWNKSCNYSITDMPSDLFFHPSNYYIAANDGSVFDSVLPLKGFGPQWSAAEYCFGPGQQYNETLVAAGTLSLVSSLTNHKRP
jgi:hypothetical protein